MIARPVAAVSSQAELAAHVLAHCHRGGIDGSRPVRRYLCPFQAYGFAVAPVRLAISEFLHLRDSLCGSQPVRSGALTAGPGISSSIRLAARLKKDLTGAIVL